MDASSSVAALLICVAAPAGVSAQAPRYGYVDVRRVLDATQDGIRARARLRRVFRERQADLDRRQAELRDSFRSPPHGCPISELGLEAMIARYRTAYATVQSVHNAYQGELLGLEAQLTDPIRRRIADVIAQLQAEGYVIAADGERLMRPAYVEDLTELVIARYERSRAPRR